MAGSDDSTTASAPTPLTGSKSATASSRPTGDAVLGADALYLSDVPKSFFVRQPINAVRGAAKMSNEEYPSSYSFRFSGCGNCTYEADVNLPTAYNRFTGTVGLTDESRHDAAVDGIVYFSAYSQTGALLFGPQKIEYPAKVPFDINTTDVTRLRLSVANGTNSEIACWCDAQFAK
ncbi:NPCBM/NEW2 domain-containing protein [Saccharothrix sp. S26]|uniref:NPCBM/NEW2 domain-containing protein n=1 Tax=Saccharothrix sp. S26 TaxID=2907215 RepID=UPI001F1AE674|nr:NPCBM/NEW2 domain-containing protein [Saccharothrix sp. S26]MCE6996146.1 NPCBM/NEW2 domain-containing protein [Saccharothrix sp. S26]